MGDWHDYVALLPTLAAVANGFIAVVVAQFLHERRRARMVLVAAAGVIAFSAIGATIYGQHALVAIRDAERSRKTDIREHLGEYILRGTNLMLKCADGKVPPPEDEANAWASEVETYLATLLGNSYVTTFRDSTGILPVSLNGDVAHRNLWFGI
jgi:hypothetical protein